MSSWLSSVVRAASGASWLWPDLDLQLSLSAGACVGEPYLSDDLGGEVFAVPAEAYIGGVAWTYKLPDEAGGTVGPRISGTVRVQPRPGAAADPALGVWHGGIEVCWLTICSSLLLKCSTSALYFFTVPNNYY
jgi:hypothetical protein